MAEIAAVATGVPAGGAGAGGATDGAGSGGGVATEIDPGAGGTDSGTAGGAGEGGTEDGEPAGDGTDGAESGTEGEPAEGAEETAGTEDPEEFSQDGRRVDDKTRKALAQVKKVDPAAAKTLADTYHRAQRIMKDVGAKNLSEAVNKVAGMAATLESVGGEEGITEMQTSLQQFNTEVTQFAEGDPALIQSLWDSGENGPKGVEKSTTASLALIASKDADMFDRVLLPPMVARLEKAGMFTTVASLAALIKDGKGQEAYDLTVKLSNWLANAKTYQKNQLELREKKDPEKEKLETRARELDQRETQIYENRIGVDVNKLNNSAMSKTVEPFFKEIKLPDNGRKRFIDGLQSEIWAAMKADKVFQRQAAAIKAKGDAERTTEFVHAKFRELLPDTFRRYRNELYPNYQAKPVLKKAAPANGADKTTTGDKAPVKVNHVPGTRPKFSDVSWASEGGKTTDIDWIRGKAWLKNGKQVEFDPNSPPNRL